jgi:RNA polymerase-associated protein CTR9
LQLDAKCVGALVGLAIMEMNAHTQAGIRHGVQLLGQAYQLTDGKHDSMVLNLLANHFFFTKVCLARLCLSYTRARRTTQKFIN